MTRNILNKLSVRLQLQQTDEEMILALVRSLDNFDEVYSWLLYGDYDGDVLSGYTVEFMVSQTDEYNTLQQEDVVTAVMLAIHKHRGSSVKRYVLGYKQPPLDIMLHLYEPLVQSLARRQHSYWRQLEYEDLCQMCRLCICVLYNGGYYLHKQLISRTFTNYVLQQLRHDRYAPPKLSLNTAVSNDDGKPCELGDIVPDNFLAEQLQDEEDAQYVRDIREQQRDFIIEEIGPRQYDLLLDEYGSGATTNRTQKLVYRLKDKMRQMGINRRSFDK